jgi:hypothetical protein
MKKKVIGEWTPKKGDRERPEADWKFLMECDLKISCAKCNEFNRREERKRARELEKELLEQKDGTAKINEQTERDRGSPDETKELSPTPKQPTREVGKDSPVTGGEPRGGEGTLTLNGEMAIE